MATSPCSSLSVSAWPRGATSPWTPRLCGRQACVPALSTRASVRRRRRGHERYDAIRKEWSMPVRLVITTYAKPGKGAELAQAMADRCRAVQQGPGCQQLEVFQCALGTDKLVVIELWDGHSARERHST